MTSTQSLPHPLAVRDLRIHLAQNQVITRQQLFSIADYDLTCYLINQPGFPEQDLTEEDGLHWKCRDLAKWMREHSELSELYVEGKRRRNPSGRTCEDNEKARQRKLSRLA